MQVRMLASALALAGLLGAGAAQAAPEADMVRQAAMATRFQPFDAGAGPEWEAAFPSPTFRTVAEGDRDAASLTLTAGAYMVVVLCNCEQMDATLVAPDGSTPPPSRVNDQGAMYSIDASQAGSYLVGVDMHGCAESPCDFAIKTWRRK